MDEGKPITPVDALAQCALILLVAAGQCVVWMSMVLLSSCTGEPLALMSRENRASQAKR